VLEAQYRPESKVLTALQDLFQALEVDTVPVSPVALIKAFGWERYHLFHQQNMLQLFMKFMQTVQYRPDGKAAYNTFMDLFFWHCRKSTVG
jgi:hypothetical protein